MSNFTTLIDQISQSQSQKEVTANAVLDAASPATMFGRRASTSASLTWGYYGGYFINASGVPTLVANGTIGLTGSATNYLTVTPVGAIATTTSSPTGWPGPLANGNVALYSVVTGASSNVTSWTDYRAPMYRFSSAGTFCQLKAVVNNNASGTYTVAAGVSYVAFTGTNVGTVAFTFPAGAAGLDGLVIEIYTAAAVVTSSTWASTGTTFIGAPATLTAGSTTRFIYHHATTNWLPK
jgi:hypothetical protein